MTRKSWKFIYQQLTGTLDFNHAIWKEHRDFLITTYRVENQEVIDWYKQKMLDTIFQREISMDYINYPIVYSDGSIGMQTIRQTPLAPLPTAQCHPGTLEIPPEIWYRKDECQKQQGNNPMYNKSATSSIDLIVQTANPAKSDSMIQREYLLQQIAEMTRYQWAGSSSWYGTVLEKLRKQFNINAPTAPKTSQEIIDAFKNGKIVIDQAKVDAQTKFFAKRDADEDTDDLWDDGISGRYYGITFTDLPVADRKGYAAAIDQLDKLIEATRRKIMILDPVTGLDALTALEAWTPTTATS